MIVGDLPIATEVAWIAISVLLGLFIGLEREWSNKPAGIRTFSLLAVSGAIFAIIGIEILIAMGVLFVIVLGVLLGVQGISEGIPEEDGFESLGLSLTTSTSLLVTYSVGVLVGYGYLIEAVVVAVVSSMLLVLKDELHSFAGSLTSDEIRSAIEFAILAFVVYPLLPNEPVDPWGVINPRLVWALVVAISAIGFVNYIIVRKYAERGFVFTAFFGGLVNSTAVVISLTRQSQSLDAVGRKSLAVSSILLANSAMAIRNAVIAVLFIPLVASIEIVIPLVVMAVSGVILSYWDGWDHDISSTDISSPFSLKTALSFGGLFLLVLVITAIAESLVGRSGVIGAQFLAGLVSSGSATTTVVTLYESEAISQITAMYAIIAGSIASVLVKTVFAAKLDWDLVRPITIYNIVLILAALISAILLNTMF